MIFKTFELDFRQLQNQKLNTVHVHNNYAVLKYAIALIELLGEAKYTSFRTSPKQLLSSPVL